MYKATVRSTGQRVRGNGVQKVQGKKILTKVVYQFLWEQLFRYFQFIPLEVQLKREKENPGKPKSEN